MADIFISYSKQSKAEAEQLANELRAKGLTIWYDTSLVAGDSFGEVILSELARARAAIVIWDAASVKSEWVRSEASRARARRILIPVRTDGIRSHDIPPPFDSLHTELLSNRAAICAALAKLGVTSMLAMKDETSPPPALADNAGRPALALPNKPSIAVLPFKNMSGDPEQDYFCDGLVEDIITTLSKLAGLRVIARNSTFVYKGRSVDIREAAKQLGVRYMLEGSVRKSGNRIRITAQLIDARDGAHLWAERYDRAMDDIFAVQDEITLVLATEMQVKLTEGEHARLHYTTTTNVEAWTYWVQGMSHHRQSMTKEAQGQARFFWEKALALDPNSASLNAELGLLHTFDARFGWWDDRKTSIEKALAYVNKALAIDPGNADAFTASSLVLLFQQQHEKAVAAARKAVELAPGAADTAELASHVLAASGYPEEAVMLGEKAMILNPNYPAVYLGTLGNAYRLSGRTEQAIEAFQAYHDRNPGFGLTDMVIAYQQTGRPEEARRTAEQLLVARPNFTVAAWLKTQFSRRDTTQVEADAAALRAAGLPLG